MQLSGRRVTIRTPRLDDAERRFKWFSDPEVTRFLPLAGKGHIPLEDIRAFLARVMSSDRPELAVSVDLDDQNVGCGGLRHITSESAELSIVIGETHVRGQGIGSEAVRLLLDYGFGVLNLQLVWLIVRADNERAIRLFERLGFVRTEVLSGAVVIDGVARDKWRMTAYNTPA